jgi:hypothetical protein
MSMPEKKLPCIVNKYNQLGKLCEMLRSRGWPWNESFSMIRAREENISHVFVTMDKKLDFLRICL